MERPFERVYTVNEFWDGPRAGFTEFNGAPHVYRSLYRDDLGNWDPDDRFLLRRITPEVLALALEDWEIWLRWSDAFKRGEVTIDTHPAIPADAARHREINPVVKQALHPAGGGWFMVSAEMRLKPGSGDAGASPGRRELEVRWTPLAEGHQEQEPSGAG